MTDPKLEQLIDDAALWSGIAESQLAVAAALHTRGLEPYRVLESLTAAQHALGKAAAAVSEFVALAERDTQPPPPPKPHVHAGFKDPLDEDET